jgi:hypothetical protein
MKKNIFSLTGIMLVLIAAFNACKKNGSEIPVTDNKIPVVGRLINDIMPLPEIAGSNATGVVNAVTVIPSVVSPIVLIPQGSSISEYQKKQIQMGLENVRTWYQRELPSKDVKWEPIRYMNGAKTAAYYIVNNNVWNEIPAEIKTNFGWNPWEVNAAGNHIALVLGRDLLGWAGGGGTSDGRGVAIVGLESLIDLPRVASEWWGTQEFWHGTVIHELGHGFTLPHPNPNDPVYTYSMMGFHSEYRIKHFVGTEPGIVQANPATGTKGPKPIANWTYDRLSAANTVPDESAANTVTLLNGATLLPGLVENAAYFDGVNDQAVTAANACNVSGGLTISAWINPLTVAGSQTIINKWYAADSYMLAIQNGYFEFSVVFPNGSWGTVKSVKAPAVNNQWQHVVGQYDGANIRIYVNKVLMATIPASGTIQASARPVSMGNHPSWNKYYGYLKNVKIYNAGVPIGDIATY